MYACVEPYEFKSLGTEKALVVDASLTNESREHFVDLSFTYNIEERQDTPVSGAFVNIVDEEGVSTGLREKYPGHYVTDSLFAGQIGSFYNLVIDLGDGNTFESAEELLREPVLIDSIYGRYITIPSDENETNVTGVQIFIDAHSKDPQPLNLRYDFRESFEVKVPYPSVYDWSGTGANFQIFEREKIFETCYRKYNSTNTILTSTFGLTENRVSEYPIKFMNENEPDLAYNYIIGVRQHSISDEAYAYHVALREANESGGSFFDRQKGTFFGNISATGDTKMEVLGYFEVSGSSETKRLFNYEEFEPDGITTQEWICTQTEEEGCVFFHERLVQILFEREVFRIDRNGDTIHFTEQYQDLSGIDGVVHNHFCELEWRLTDIPHPGTHIGYAHKWCSDCTEYGLLDRPEVWDD